MDRNNTRAPNKMEFVAPLQSLNVAKKESEISLTPSQISRLEKSNALKKNPLDAITRPPKINEYLEKRSGLQNVREDNYNAYFSTPFHQKNSGLTPPEPRAYNNNPGQQQIQQQQIQQQQMQQQQMQQQQMQQQQMQQQQMQQPHMHQHPDGNAMNHPGNTPVGMENKVPPSEPNCGENVNTGNAQNPPEGGFCTTCPNCSARILLVPETETRANEHQPPQQQI